MAKVEIKPYCGSTDILVNGTALNNVVSYAIHQQVGMELPTVEIKLLGYENEYLFENAEVHIDIKPDSLQSAAAIVRSELLKQGDWYNALISSLENGLREPLSCVDAIAYDIAKVLANMLIGLEDKPC